MLLRYGANLTQQWGQFDSPLEIGRLNTTATTGRIKIIINNIRNKKKIKMLLLLLAAAARRSDAFLSVKFETY